MKKNNMPLNLRERINSRISLLCSVIVLVLLVLVMHQMDYTLIRKRRKKQQKQRLSRNSRIRSKLKHLSSPLQV